MENVMLKIENVSKVYKLGQIGGTTLRDEIQRKIAKLRHQEDPTKIIGEKSYNKGETFMALNDVSFEVKKGERVGIIGHNGAGKSTLLKLISRVTAPTDGTIFMNGRVASMLEVGTGFHPELTGRENIYMNGAILGMTKKEIDSKMEDIIEFSECRQFIDTPVKRYSSGMYVKLAFSVAAHLDSEIMIMDEVLAVGDMAFQNKCIGKMCEVSMQKGRTILYVSHNMNTIRELCDRCIVLNHGKIIFNGDVEKAIAVYSGMSSDENPTSKSLKSAPRYISSALDRTAEFTYMEVLNKEKLIFSSKENLFIKLVWTATKEISNTSVRFVLRDSRNIPIASSMCIDFGKTVKEQENSRIFSFPLRGIVAGRYAITLVLLEKNASGVSVEKDVVMPAFWISITSEEDIKWSPTAWGNIRLEDAVADCIVEKGV